MAHREPHFAHWEWMRAYNIRKFFKITGADDRGARGDFLDASPKVSVDSSGKIENVGFGCYRCKKWKARCDQGLPHCGRCKRANVICKNSDAVRL